MTIKVPNRLFITGTDTDVGKTLVSAILMLGLDAHYWKPIQSGTQEGTDTAWIMKTTELPADRFLPEKYRLRQPLSPHLAAQLDGKQIDLKKLCLPEPCPERLIVEGAGGLMVPIHNDYFVADLISQLKLPVIVVARSKLGTINHTILTVQELRRRNLEIVGVIMNGEVNDSNRQAIEQFAKVPVLAQIPILPKINRDSLLSCFR